MDPAIVADRAKDGRRTKAKGRVEGVRKPISPGRAAKVLDIPGAVRLEASSLNRLFEGSNYSIDAVARQITESVLRPLARNHRALALIYLRNALASNRIPVWACSVGSEISPPTKVLDTNIVKGLHPFVSVLDAMTARTTAEHSGRYRCDITVEEGGTMSHPPLLVESRDGLEGSWAKVTARYDARPSDDDSVIGFLKKCDSRSGWAECFRRHGTMIASCASAAAHLAMIFGLPPDPLIIKSLVASLQDALLYHAPASSGSQSCFLVKPDHTMGFTVGLQLWAPAENGRELSAKLLDGVWTRLQEAQKELNEAYVGGRSNEWSDALKHLQGHQEEIDSGKRSSVPSSLVSSLSARVLGRPTEEPVSEDLFARERVKIRRDVQRFLEVTTSFSNETVEGRDLDYGILLGEPFHTRFWPGELPISLDYSSEDDETTLEHVRKALHLTCGADDRCVAMPYGAFVDMEPSASRVRQPLHSAVYSVELADYSAAVSTSRYSRLLTRTAGTYALITSQCPWAVAAVVGPGARQAVYNRGVLVAVRDGKGWCTRTNLVHDLASRLREEELKQHAPSLRVLAASLLVAEQSSPYVRPDARGSLIVYRRGGYHDGKGKGTSRNRQAAALEDWQYIEAYPLGEEWKLEQGKLRWLTSKNLLLTNTFDRDASPGELSHRLHEEMATDVARKIIRATMLDGAVMLSGPLGRVEGYAMQIQVPHAGTRGRPAGTKQLTAQRFAALGGPGSFAIATSSDGPVRVWYNLGPEFKVEPVQLFERTWT